RASVAAAATSPADVRRASRRGRPRDRRRRSLGLARAWEGPWGSERDHGGHLRDAGRDRAERSEGLGTERSGAMNDGGAGVDRAARQELAHQRVELTVADGEDEQVGPDGAARGAAPRSPQRHSGSLGPKRARERRADLAPAQDEDAEFTGHGRA